MSNSFVLVINSGSSSLKFAVIDSKNGDTLLSGIGECFGLPEAEISWKYQGEKFKEAISTTMDHHKYSVQRVVKLLETLGLSDKFIAVGHRIVAGGERFKGTVRVDEQVIADVERLAEFAPLHNKANAAGMKAAQEAFPELPQFAVFDTAFHQTMPAKAFMYAVPYELYQEHKIRRYGAHGTSHYYVGREAAKMMNLDVASSSFITVHLGNGASVCSIKNGECVDTSMGLTPLAGLMMGTRCGDLDPSVIEHLFRKGWKEDDISEMMHKKSGFLGVSGVSSDVRSVFEAIEQGNERAKLAVDIFTYRVSKYIAGYLATLDSLDGIVFTGGIGENSMEIRRDILANLKLLGFAEDEKGNEDARFGHSGIIGKSELLDAIVMVIPTNEEYVIAQQSVELL